VGVWDDNSVAGGNGSGINMGKGKIKEVKQKMKA
jgi:hypothetical protein